MRKLLIPFITIAALTFASTAEAGPIRNILGKLRGKPRAAAAKVLGVAKAPLRAVGNLPGKLDSSACAGGACAK